MTGLPRQFETGIEEIDAQHVEFIRMIKEIQARIGGVPEPSDIAARLERLSAYARKHFATEKEYMERLDYPAAGEHMKEHAFLLEKISELQKRYATENRSVAMYDILDFMQSWLLEHIPGSDKEFADFARSKK